MCITHPHSFIINFHTGKVSECACLRQAAIVKKLLNTQHESSEFYPACRALADAKERWQQRLMRASVIQGHNKMRNTCWCFTLASKLISNQPRFRSSNPTYNSDNSVCGARTHVKMLRQGPSAHQKCRDEMSLLIHPPFVTGSRLVKWMMLRKWWRRHVLFNPLFPLSRSCVACSPRGSA